MLINVVELQRCLPEKPFLMCSLLEPVGVSSSDVLEQRFIPGTQLFNIADFACHDSAFPNMLLPPADFTSKVRKLGLNQDDWVVVYDTLGMYSAPRLWFNLKLMGFENVSLLDGGLPLWQDHGYGLEDVVPAFTEGNFTAKAASEMVVTHEDLQLVLSDPAYQIIDVRSTARFQGLKPEPRKGLKSGHIPTSVNIPFADFLDGHCFKKKQALQEVFDTVGCQKSQHLIFSCGSGITACIGYVAAKICGYNSISVYDGSWTEWGSLDLPIETL